MNVCNSLTARRRVLVHEVNNLPPITVPGQDMSIQEVLMRYQQGRDVSTFNGVYTDNPFVPDGWERMDIQERLDYQRMLKSNVLSAAADLQRRADVSQPPTPAPVQSSDLPIVEDEPKKSGKA